MILVTGGAGFIGANFVLDWLAQSDEAVINLDILSYAGNLENLAVLAGDERHIFVRGDIGNTVLVSDLLRRYRPRAVVHFAAESHVDRSIHGPETFIQTNIVGTFRLLEAVRSYWHELDEKARKDFRFLHISTDEVYGSLAKGEPAFTEAHQYQPNSPYSASKARQRPSGARISSYLWPACTHHKLLEQLRSLSISRKAYPPHDRQCAWRQAFACLWRRPADSRLVVCKGSLRRHCSNVAGGHPRGNIQHRRLERKTQHRNRQHYLRAPG